MYVCGPTVYNYAHIGNARPAVIFDILYRLLRLYYPKVIYARNITDVDDKILAKAEEENSTIKKITERYYNIYKNDMAALQVTPPTLEPRATDHIPKMIEIIQCLIQKKHAYEAQGHVIFDTPSFKRYGQLSNRNRKDMIAGARVEIAPYKKDPADFVLWKPSTKTQVGWDSPWGRGRPGWHIECSAMIHSHFGECVDIHGGGQDLIFPHHENEIAQSACIHEQGMPCASFWLHNGFVNINQEKMSKSLQNTFLIHDLLQNTAGESLRLALLSVHYRAPLNWTSKSIAQANSTLDRFYECIRKTTNLKSLTNTKKNQYRDKAPKAFLATLDDDLNTSSALAVMHEIVVQINTEKSQQKQSELREQLLACGDTLGILQQDPQAWFQEKKLDNEISPKEVEKLIQKRNKCRELSDFTGADSIRDRLEKEGIQLKDNTEGTSWQRQRPS